ncbi:MAG TPA: hypothetical protein VH306_02335 [Gaiellaceae bacterium]
MEKGTKRKIAAGTVAGLAVASASGAVAASKLHAPKAESDAVLTDAAKQLGVSTSELRTALKTALENRVDAAVADGRLTKEQGAELKKRIEANDFPILGGGPGPGRFGPHFRAGFGHFGRPGPFGELDRAAAYLGLSEQALRTQLQSGKSLGQIAKAQGKSADGLVDVLVAAVEKRLDTAVEAGRMSKEDEKKVLSDVEARVKDFVDGAHFRWFRHEDGDGRGSRFDGPPAPAMGAPRL